MDAKTAQGIREMAKTILAPVNQAPAQAQAAIQEALEALDSWYPEYAPMPEPQPQQQQMPAPKPAGQSVVDQGQLLNELIR